MFEWFNKLLPAQATIIAAIFGAFVTILIAMVTIGVKDYLFPVLAERRAAKKKRNETFKLYANPLILSSISLLFRLKEILSDRGHFLLDDAPKNEFTDYKYLSTIYRFCCFLGWVRASTIELSFVEVKSSRQYKRIQSSIGDFELSLADGQDIELAVLVDLSKLWRIDISGLTAQQKDSLGVAIENLTDRFCYKEKVEMVNQLSDNEQLQLAIQLNRLIATQAGGQPANAADIHTTLIDFIKELSRTLGLIYRDWQAAIGDMMIKKTEKEARKYEVIGYKEFEAVYLKGDDESKKWFTRANKVFKNLDVKVDDRFDGRTKQLKGIYSATYEILQAFARIKTSNVGVASNALKKLPKKM